MSEELKSGSEQKKEDWMNSKWRPMMGWMYMLVCTMDFVGFPILWSLLQSLSHGSVNTQWQPLTLQGAGLFHIAMGAVIGISAYGRTQEKLGGANNGGLGAGTTYTPPAPVSGGFGNATTNVPSSGAPAFGAPSTGFGASPSGFGSTTTAPAASGFGGGGFGSVPSTAPAVNSKGLKVIPQDSFPAL